MPTYEEEAPVPQQEEPAAPPQEEPAAPPPDTAKLDLANEELFPALPVPTVGKVGMGIWGAKPANGKPAVAARPLSAIRHGGKVTDRFEIPEITKKVQEKLTGPQGKQLTVGDVVKQIMSRTSTSIEMSTNNKTRSVTFLVNGKPDAVKIAKRELISRLTVPVTQSISIPASVRPHILGKGGANLRALTARTLTNIQIPRERGDENIPVTDELQEDEPEQEVIITGDFEGVEQARKEIEGIVAQRTSKHTIRVNVERSFHPFVAGPNNSQLNLIQAETGARIHIPPMVPSSSDKNLNEILLVGERAAVLDAEERVKAIYDEVKRTTRTLAIPVKKRQHRFIIGPKGSTLQEILNKTGCFVELPASADPSEMITIRGPDSMLSTALQVVLEKSNAVLIEDIDVVSLLPRTTDPQHFLRYLYTKERNSLKTIESAHSSTIHQQTSAAGTPILEIQAKSKAEVDAARLALYNLLKEWGQSLCFGAVDIPRGLHKFVVGRGGQNITKMKAKADWAGRLVDVVVAPENEESDEVIIVVKRVVPAAVGKGGGSLAASDKEASELIEKVKEEVIAEASVLADFVNQTVNIDPKYHGRLIGAGGAALKDLLAPYNNAVSVRFPHVAVKEGKEGKDTKEASPNAIVVKGPKKEVAEVVEKINKHVAEWRHVEVMSSFSETVKVPKGVARKIVGNGGSGGQAIGWILRTIKDKIAAGEIKDKTVEKDLAGNFNLRVEVADGSSEDVITIFGPKNIVAVARGVVSERSQKVADTVNVEVKLFEAVSSKARKLMEEVGGDIKRKALRRIIGKEGKVVKRVSEKFSVWVKFAEKKGRKPSGDGDEDDGFDADALDEREAPPDGVVVIRGNKADVEPAKKELIELLEYEILHSFVVTFDLPKATLPHVVGRAGSKIMKLKEVYDVRIDFRDKEEGEAMEGAEVECTIEGTKDDCMEVKKSICETVDDMVGVVAYFKPFPARTLIGMSDQVNTETVTLQIPSYLHKNIIGPAGSNVRKVVEQFGGQDKVKIQFPKPNVDPQNTMDTVTIKANRKILPDIRREIEMLVSEALGGGDVAAGELISAGDDSLNIVEEIISIPKSDVARVVGRGGEGLKEVMKKSGVTIWVLDQEDEENRVKVRIVGRQGKEEGIASAKADILSKLRATKSIPIPPEIVELIKSSNPEQEVHLMSLQDIAKRVRNDFGGIMVDVRTKEAPHFSVRGDQKSVESAGRAVMKHLEELTKYSHTHRLSVDAEIRPHIIGRGGAIINRIRAESGANIDIVRAAKGGKDSIVIRGTSAESVDTARAAIEAIVREQEERLKRDAERLAQQREREAQRAERAVPARIDDDDASETSSAFADSGNAVPGYSGRAPVPSRSGRGKKKRADDSSGVSGVSTPTLSRDSSSAWLYASAPAKDDNQWQSVGKRGKKGPDTAAEAAPSASSTVPGGVSSGEKKKKNKKKKAAAATQSEAAAVDESAPAAAETAAPAGTKPPPPSKISQPAPAPAQTTRPSSPNKQPPAPAPKISSPKKQPATSIPVTQEAKAAPVSEPPKQQAPPASTYHPEIEARPAEDDGWQTVNSVKKYKQQKLAAEASTAPAAPRKVNGSGPAPAQASGSGEGAKKKKNKKKKKKASGDAMPGDVSDDE
ncbi:hypothetical protein HK104_005822 [Borealophlyctis nickersoniae]|nr:hypothetical protein HK104_005822 [Borealophlyctis nickersoniae]